MNLLKNLIHIRFTELDEKTMKFNQKVQLQKQLQCKNHHINLKTPILLNFNEAKQYDEIDELNRMML